MSQYVAAPKRSFPISSFTSAPYLRVKFSGSSLALAGSTDQELGVLADRALSGDTSAAVMLRTSEGTTPMIASEAITKGNPVYAAADGKVAASGTVLIGIALQAATASGDQVEVLRRQETSDSAAAGGTTAAAFTVDSDATTPKIELAAQTAGTGDYTATIKPPATLTGDHDYTLAVDAAGKILVDACFAATPDDAEGAGNSIPAGYTSVAVGAVTNDANDFVVLPAIAGVPIGFTIRIACNAGGNFELRTPASSNTKINDVDSDGTQEYLCTDTDLVIVTKRTTTGWVAQSITKLGAVRTAVVPD